MTRQRRTTTWYPLRIISTSYAISMLLLLELTGATNTKVNVYDDDVSAPAVLDDDVAFKTLCGFLHHPDEVEQCRLQRTHIHVSHI